MTETRSRPSLVSILPTLSLALAITCSGCASHTTASYDIDKRLNANHASAVILSRGPFGISFDLSAKFMLPDIRANRGWYTNWFLLKEGSYFGGPFFQVGLIRDNEVHDSTLRPFIAGRNGKGPFYYRSFSRITDASHKVSLVGTPTLLTLRIDGTRIVSVDRNLVFPPRSGDLYLMIGHELEKPGDVAEGEISNIHLSPSGSRADERPLEDLHCYFSHHGIAFLRAGDAFKVRGDFNPSVADKGTGDASFASCFHWSLLRLLH